MKKNLRYFMTLLLMMVASVGWGQTTVSMTSFTAISGYVGNDENISYEAAKGNAGTAPAVNSGEIRVYQNGGTFTVTAHNGSKINSITLGSSMATTVTYKVDNGDTSENQSIAVDGPITVSDLNASSVLFTCTGTDKNHRLYVNNLSVTYTASSVAPAGLAFDPSEVTLKVGETSTSTFSQKTSAIATFTNSNESVATYDPTTGSISAKAVGTTTITATAAEVSGTYQAGEATLTINVQKAAVEGEIFYESFDNCNGTGGNDDSWSGTIANTNFDNDMADNSGWVLEKGSAAKQCIKLGTGSAKGSATTPTITFEQGYQYTITFKAAAWNGGSEGTTLNLSTTAGVLDNESVTMEKGEWSTYNITINTTTTSGTITFEAGNVSNNRFFLDEISITKGEAVEVKTIPTLSFPETSYEVIVGKTFSAPILTSNSDGVVSYSSSNTDVASVDASTGAVSIVGVGTTTITATSAETDTYYEGTATYTLIVNPDPDGPGTENNPFTVAEAIEYINGLSGTSPNEVYVSGIISQVDSYSSQYHSITYWISDDGETTTQMEVYSGKGLNNTNFSAVTDLKVGDEVTVRGSVKMYNSTPEFDKNNYLTSFNRPNAKADAELSYARTTVSKQVGDANFTNELNNPHKLSVTYSSSNESVATVDENGEVTIVATGSTIITATSAGTDEYEAGEASYTLTVTGALVSIDADGNVIFNLAENGWSFPDSKTVDEGQYTNSGYTLTIVGSEGNGYYFFTNTNGESYTALLMGKSGASLTLPAFDFDVEKIEVTGASNASASVVQNIFVGENAASTETTGAKGTNSYEIGADYQAAGNIYTLKVTSAHNTQITSIKVYKKQDVPANITLSPAKEYTTLTSAYALDFTNTGLSAYIVKEEDVTATSVKLTQVSKVPANTGLVIQKTGTENSYSVPVLTGEPDDVSENKMVGSATETTTIAENAGYILKDGIFRPSAGGTLSAGKAYLDVAVPTTGAKDLAIVFGEGTGINNVNVNENESGKIFNLAGQQMKSAVKGVYIKNGKKYIK